jgi:hypothetical protein
MLRRIDKIGRCHRPIFGGHFLLFLMGKLASTNFPVELQRSEIGENPTGKKNSSACV